MVKAENFGQQEINFRKIMFSVTAKRRIFRKLIFEIRLKSIQTNPKLQCCYLSLKKKKKIQYDTNDARKSIGQST